MIKFQIGDRVRKTKGSQWRGVIVGTYSTELTSEGYCVESDTHKGSVQIYPATALELIKDVKMSPERAVYELRSWCIGARVVLQNYLEDMPENKLAEARLRESHFLFASTDHFKPTIEQLNLWSEQRRSGK